MADNIEAVGARLSILGRAQFVAGLSAATDSANAFADAMARIKEESADLVMPSAFTASLKEQAAAQKAAADAAQEGAAVQADAADTVVAANAKTATSAEESAEAQAAAQKKASDAAIAAAKKAQVVSDQRWAAATATANKILKWGSIAAAIVGYESVKSYMTFQQQMEQVSTQAGIAQSRIPFLSSGVIAISKQTGVSFANVADQLYRIASAKGGLHETNQELLALTKSAALLTVLGGPTTDAEQVARVFGAVSSAGAPLKTGGGVATPQQIAAWANAVVGSGDMRMQDLVSALGTGILVPTKAYHTSMQDIGAWLDVMSSQAMSGSKAGALIGHAESLLATPSQAAAGVEQMFGFTRGALEGDMQKYGLGYTINALNHAFATGLKNVPGWYSKFYGTGLKGEETYLQAEHFTPAQIQGMLGGINIKTRAGLNMVDQLLTLMFGGAKQELPVLTLLQESGLYNAKLAAIQKASSTSTFNEDVKHSLDEPANQLKILLQNIKALGLTIGKDLIPPLMDFLHIVEDVGSWFSHNKWAMELLGFGGLDILGAAAGVKILSTGRSIYKGITSIIGLSSKGLGLNGSAAALTQSAADLSLAAAKLSGASIAEGEGGILADSAAAESSFWGVGGVTFAKVAAPIFALAAGYAIGTELNRTFHISNWLASLIVHSGVSKAQAAADNAGVVDLGPTSTNPKGYSPAAWHRFYTSGGRTTKPTSAANLTGLSNALSIYAYNQAQLNAARASLPANWSYYANHPQGVFAMDNPTAYMTDENTSKYISSLTADQGRIVAVIKTNMDSVLAQQAQEHHQAIGQLAAEEGVLNKEITSASSLIEAANLLIDAAQKQQSSATALLGATSLAQSEAIRSSSVFSRS